MSDPSLSPAMHEPSCSPTAWHKLRHLLAPRSKSKQWLCCSAIPSPSPLALCALRGLGPAKLLTAMQGTVPPSLTFQCADFQGSRASPANTISANAIPRASSACCLGCANRVVGVHCQDPPACPTQPAGSPDPPKTAPHCRKAEAAPQDSLEKLHL